MMHARPWLDGKTNSAIMEIGSQKPMTAKHSQPQAMKKKDNNKKEITFYKCRKMGNYLNKRTNRKRSSFLVLNDDKHDSSSDEDVDGADNKAPSYSDLNVLDKVE